MDSLGMSPVEQTSTSAAASSLSAKGGLGLRADPEAPSPPRCMANLRPTSSVQASLVLRVLQALGARREVARHGEGGTWDETSRLRQALPRSRNRMRHCPASRYFRQLCAVPVRKD